MCIHCLEFSAALKRQITFAKQIMCYLSYSNSFKMDCKIKMGDNARPYHFQIVKYFLFNNGTLQMDSLRYETNQTGFLHLSNKCLRSLINIRNNSEAGRICLYSCGREWDYTSLFFITSIVIRFRDVPYCLRSGKVEPPIQTNFYSRNLKFLLICICMNWAIFIYNNYNEKKKLFLLPQVICF